MAGPLDILYLAEAEPEAAVLSSGVLAHMVREARGARFTVVGSPQTAPLFRDTPGLEKLIVLPGESRADWFRLWDRLKDRRWSVIVDMRGSELSRWLRREKRAVRAPSPEPEHAVLAAARVLRLEEPAAPLLYFGEETKAAADARVGTGRPILAVGPGVDWIGKRWPAERFTKVAARLLGPGGPMEGGRLMLEMRPDCERCGTDLPAEAPGAFICSFECTFCAECADALDDRCPNCGGELMDRPTRAKKLHDQYPPSAERKFRG